MENWKKRFICLGIGQAVSMLTSSILQIAIIWYLTERTGSATVITLATLFGYLPRAVLGLFSGVFIDRFNRKTVLILSDLFIALAALVLAAAAFWTELPILLIYVILCVRSMGAAFHTPTLNAIIPSIVPKENLTQCAGILQGFDSVSLILSPAIAAFLFDFWNLGEIVLLDIVGAVIAIVIVLLLSIPKNAAAQTAESLHIWQDTKKGFAVLKSHKGMMALLLISSAYAFLYFPIGSMYPLITMTYFGGSFSDSSVVEIVFSAGTLIGSVLLGIIGKRINKIRAIAASIGIYGLGAMLSGMLPPSGMQLFIVFSAIMGLTIPFFYGLRTSIFQSRIPSEYLGRTLSLAYNVSLFAAPFGLMLGGGFSEAVGVNRCFFVCGLLSIVLALAIIFTPSIHE